MRIATYLDEQSGELKSLYESGVFRIYDNVSGIWCPVQSVTFSAALCRMRIGDIKQSLKVAVAEFVDCKVILSAEVRGMIYSVLQEELGFRTWKSTGSLLEQLDSVAQIDASFAEQQAAEAAAAAQAPKVRAGGCGAGGGSWRPRQKTAPPAAERIADGHYRIDLADVLARDPNLNSRLALIPIMEDTPFQKLEILCDHVPRWFSQKLTALNLRAEVEHTSKGVRALVFPNVVDKEM
jgi:Fe-only nitrogenase accessory protein AnfO